jgi:predicted alpha-1,2-mannosidase
MTIKHMPRRSRLPLTMPITISLIAAGLAMTGSQAAGAAQALPVSGGVCSSNPRGNLVNCPRPVARRLLPAPMRDNAVVTKPVASPATYLDARTWTSGGGNTFPGADVPFGMLQWSPDTLPNRSDGGGYTFSDTKLDGYALTHLSGPGCKAAGDVPILPMTGKLPDGNPTGERTSFSHSGEVATAGFYQARSNEPNTITSAFSATPHSAIGTFRFPKTSRADFLIKLLDSQRGDSSSTATIVSSTEVQGSVTTGDFCSEGSQFGPQQYTVYFDIVFSRPFYQHRVITEPGQHSPNSMFLIFNTTASQVIGAKVGISYVSTANARLNWNTEQPGWNFTGVKAGAESAWNKLLGEVSVWGGSVARTQEFYSLLYKSLLQPDIVSDVNGEYLGSDFKVHVVEGSQASQYSMFSGWDMYHSQAQLVAMLDPDAASDMAQSLVNYYAQNGILPQWGYLNTDNYAQVGDPADAVIADYYAFGATGFDTATALTDMLAQADNVTRVRPGEALEAKDGYLPVGARYGCCRMHGEVAALLEYDTADLALSLYATALGNAAAASRLRVRANNWTHLFSNANKLLTARKVNGTFLAGVTPTTTPYFVEGDAYQYLWDVPNNYAALFGKLGGNAKVVPALVKYLSKPDGGGTFAKLANEFDLGEQFALDYARDPAGTQKAVAAARNSLYLPGPYGLPNNDDLGAEASQYIWDMLGMYPENPGSGDLVLASPGFPHAVISLPGGSVITISAPGASATRFYVGALAINGTPDTTLYVPYSQLALGATLDWTLGATPTSWGSAAKDAPPSYPDVGASSQAAGGR